MKAFVAYDESGRITDVAVPNPEFGDDIVIEATEGDSIVAIDCSDVVKAPGGLPFPIRASPGISSTRLSARSSIDTELIRQPGV
jgi:hypothetical protein